MADRPAVPRTFSIDLLRGMALLGILFVNIRFLGDSIWRVDPGAGVDAWALFLVRWFFEAKSYLIFAFLFGYGMTGAAGSAAGAGRRYARRLIGIGVFGALHAVLLFVGDILLSYALLGGTLWFARGWTSARLRRAAIVLGAAAIAGRAALGVAALLLPGDPAADAMRHAVTVAAYRGAMSDAIRQRLADLQLFYGFTPLFNWPSMLAAFAIGMLAARGRWLARPAALWRAWRPAFPWLAAGGVVGNFGYAAVSPVMLDDATWVGPVLVLEVLAAPLLAWTYVLLLCRVASRPTPPRWATASASAGRFSLTCYLGQAALANVVFAGWGVGLFGALGDAAMLGLAVGIHVVLVSAAHVWGRSFRMGPDEWLLRSFTHWRWEPMRQPPPALPLRHASVAR